MGFITSARRFATNPYAMGIFKEKMCELMHARALSKEEMRKFGESEGGYASAKGFLAAMINEAALADAAATPEHTRLLRRRHQPRLRLRLRGLASVASIAGPRYRQPQSKSAQLLP